MKLFKLTLRTLLCLIFTSSSLLSQETTTFITNGHTFEHNKRVSGLEKDAGDCDRLHFRTADGTCNNLADYEFGASDIALFRSVSPQYGISNPNSAMAGNNRPSARAISNNLCNQTESIPNQYGLSALVYAWGQFLDHDIDLTPEGEEYEPITLPSNEVLFQQEIPFHRSATYDGTGITSHRQQQNLITSFIDASNVYGSDEQRANWLRTFNQGKLKTSAGDMLPFNTVDGSFNATIDDNAPAMAGATGTNKLFVAGDVRANEQPGLTALHTLLLREHNRICEELVTFGYQSDEIIYQTARKLVSGMVQSISFNEFLPALGIDLPNYNGYNESIQPDISNIFAAVAYRLGHTMVPSTIPMRDNECNDYATGEISLFEGYFNPYYMTEYGIDPLLKGLASQVQEQVDLYIVDDLRNLLFPNFGSDVVFGLDLASLNIQRGRDHGIADYRTIRNSFTGFQITSFNDISSRIDVVAQLTATYGNINRIDPWIGMLAEDHVPGSSVGPTLQAILLEQFEKLRDGDFYYYKNDPFLTPFQLQYVESSTLSALIARNTTISNIQEEAMFADSCPQDVVDIPDNNGDNTGGTGNEGDNPPPPPDDGNNDPNGGGNNGGGGQGGNNGPGGGGNNGGDGQGGNGGGGQGGGNLAAPDDDNAKSANQLSTELNVNTISIFPNPASDSINIFSVSGAEIQGIRIMNQNGVLVKQLETVASRNVSIDCSSFSSGIYIVEVVFANASEFQRIIISNTNK